MSEPTKEPIEKARAFMRRETAACLEPQDLGEQAKIHEADMAFAGRIAIFLAAETAALHEKAKADQEWMEAASAAVRGLEAGSFTGHPVVDCVAGAKAKIASLEQQLAERCGPGFSEGIEAARRFARNTLHYLLTQTQLDALDADLRALAPPAHLRALAPPAHLRALAPPAQTQQGLSEEEAASLWILLNRPGMTSNKSIALIMERCGRPSVLEKQPSPAAAPAQLSDLAIAQRGLDEWCKAAMQERARADAAEAKLAALAGQPAPTAPINQCDGCRAGRPIDKNGNHRMGDGAYPNLQACQRHLYSTAQPAEPRALKGVCAHPLHGDEPHLRTRYCHRWRRPPAEQKQPGKEGVGAAPEAGETRHVCDSDCLGYCEAEQVKPHAPKNLQSNDLHNGRACVNWTCIEAEAGETQPLTTAELGKLLDRAAPGADYLAASLRGQFPARTESAGAAPEGAGVNDRSLAHAFDPECRVCGGQKDAPDHLPPLPAKPKRSDGLDGQPEALAAYLRGAPLDAGAAAVPEAGARDFYELHDLTDEELADVERYGVKVLGHPDTLPSLVAEVKRRRTLSSPSGDARPTQEWKSPECGYSLVRLLEGAASGYSPTVTFGIDLRAAVEHFRAHPPVAPSILEEPTSPIVDPKAASQKEGLEVEALDSLEAVIRESDRNTDAYIAARAVLRKAGRR